MHTKEIIIGVVIGTVIFGGGGFVVGKKMGAPARQFTGEFRAGAGGPGGAAGGFQGRSGGGGFVGGEVIANDATSITLKEQNGSTKIVLLSESSQISKFAEGAASDLAIGTNVMVTGSTNSDGSVTAQTVQIRPAGAPLPGGRPTQ